MSTSVVYIRFTLRFEVYSTVIMLALVWGFWAETRVSPEQMELQSSFVPVQFPTALRTWDRRNSSIL
jgi:hypothetical protein